MKPFGVIFIILGLIGGIFALQMDTSVATGYLGLDRVNNIGLMDQRQNYLIVSGLSVLTGVLLFGFDSIRRSNNGELSAVSDFRVCPFCAEHIRKAASSCRFCNREVPIITSPSELGPSGEAAASEPVTDTSCWTCTYFQKGDGWVQKYFDETKGACGKHRRMALEYETCPEHTPKNS